MKGSEIVIKVLNDLLADELTAVNQYMVHAGMCENWGYEKLHGKIEKRAIEEMKHAEMLINRVLFLNGIPMVSKLNKITIGAKVEEQIKNDISAEVGAIAAYNAAVKTCMNEADNGSRELLEHILKDEENHLDWLEAQADQIDQMGIKYYLVEQVE